MKAYVRRFQLLTTMALTIIVLLAVVFLYIPLEKDLERNMLDQFSYMVELAEYSADQYMQSNIESAKSISSRTMIREKIVQFQSGNIELDELIEYTEPRYADGIDALDQLAGAVRITNGNIIASRELPLEVDISSLNLFENYSAKDFETRFFSVSDTIYFAVKSPIVNGNEVIGNDILVFYVEDLIDNLSSESFQFSISESYDTGLILSESISDLTVRGMKISYIGDKIICHKRIINTNYDYMVSIDANTLFGSVQNTSASYIVRFLLSVLVVVILINLLSYFMAEKTVSLAESRKELYKRKFAYDKLTGIYSRSFFEDSLKEKLNEPDNTSKCSTLSLIDIDCFKKINDTRGHDAGDKVLKAVADYLIESSRNNDYVIRYGGDEFLMIFVNCSEEIAIMRMNKIRQDLLETLSISISYGVAFIEGNLDERIKIADKRMYADKKSRKIICS